MSFRSCHRADGRPKVRFSSRHDAEFAAEKIARKEGCEVRSYLCPDCHWFHVGRFHEHAPAPR